MLISMQFDPDGNISSAIGWIAMKVWADIHGPQTLVNPWFFLYCHHEVDSFFSEILLNDFQDIMDTYLSWCPDDDSYWLWRSPDFPWAQRAGQTFPLSSEISEHILKGFAQSLMQTFMVLRWYTVPLRVNWDCVGEYYHQMKILICSILWFMRK